MTIYLIFVVQKVKTINSKMSGAKEASNGTDIQNCWILAEEHIANKKTANLEKTLKNVRKVTSKFQFEG